MCLLYLILGEAPDLDSEQVRPLTLFSVRDEDFSRTTRRGSVMDQSTYAPRDELAGGTWLSIRKSHRGQRFAVVLNFHEKESMPPEECLSRGILPGMYTEDEENLSTECFIERVKGLFGKLRGFSLIFGDDCCCYYMSNRSTFSVLSLDPNVLHCFSNGDINDSPSAWPRLHEGQEVIRKCPFMDEIERNGMMTHFPKKNDAAIEMSCLLEQFRKHNYCNAGSDSTLDPNIHGSLILPPCSLSTCLYGTRTITAIASFVNGENSTGTYILESDFNTEVGAWSDCEHCIY